MTVMGGCLLCPKVGCSFVGCYGGMLVESMGWLFFC